MNERVAAAVPASERYSMATLASSKAPASIDSEKAPPYLALRAQVAELVDALVSGTSGESRGGSSPLLGTMIAARSWEGHRDDLFQRNFRA